MVGADGIGSPANAPGQEQRILAWLLTETGGLTQLQALQHLAVQRLAAMVYRLKGRGHVIRTELVEFPTRYGPATAARYHLVHLAKGCNVASIGVPVVGVEFLHPDDRPRAMPREQQDLFRVPRYQCTTCCDVGKLRQGTDTVPCPAVGCSARRRAEQVAEAYGNVTAGG